MLDGVAGSGKCYWLFAPDYAMLDANPQITERSG